MVSFEKTSIFDARTRTLKRVAKFMLKQFIGHFCYNTRQEKTNVSTLAMQCNNLSAVIRLV